MSDFLDRMASRSQGVAPILRPRPLSLFEGGPELFEEVHLESEAGVAPRQDSQLRADRHAPRPIPPRAPVDHWPAPEPERRREAAARAGALPPLARGEVRSGRSEPVEDPFPPAPDRGHRAAPAVASRAAPAPASSAPGAPIPAGTVQRRAAESPAAVAAPWGRTEPLPEPTEAAPREPEPQRLEPASTPFSQPPRPGAIRPLDSGLGRIPEVAVPTGATAAGHVDVEAAPAPAQESPAARAAEPARASPPRSGPAADSAVRAGARSSPGFHPFAPRPEAAPEPPPAPVEIRIGRIEIHAAPAAAPAAQAEAPGPSLDAFLARPRR